jgi:hypothetical protein
MFVAVVMYCTSPDVTSCKFTAHVEQPHFTEIACIKDAKKLADTLIASGVYAKHGCIKTLDMV